MNNRDILKEIHKSKNTYCSYIDAEAADYDIILPKLDQIFKMGKVEVRDDTDTDATDDSSDDINEGSTGKAKKILIQKPNIEIARANRAARLARAAYDAAIEAGEKRKLDEFTIDPATIKDTDIVFRIMTWDHIPIDNSKKGKKVTAYVDEDEVVHSEYDEEVEEVVADKYTRCNFPPFQHYRLDGNNQAICVGKSHWKGALDTGEFSKDHGTMTKKLATMFIKLCERYATRSNWRGYTYNDEMRSQALLQLSQIGLQFDESKSQNPFAYYTAAITNSFTRVLNVEKRNQNIRDDILEINGLAPSYTRQMDWGNGGSNYDD